MKSLVRKINVWLWFLAPSILFGFAAGMLPGYQMYRYTWYDAAFCTTCHVHDYATVGWSQSIHGQMTTCHDCHHQRFRDYIREMLIMIKHKPTFPQDLDHTPYVKQELCAACHIHNAEDRSTITGPMAFEDIEKIPKVDLSRLHKKHLEKETEFTLMNSHELTENERDPEHLYPNRDFPKDKGPKRLIACADCHGGPSNRGHNFSPVDASCVRCHDSVHKTQVAQQYGCRSCHFQDFLIPANFKPKQPNFMPKESPLPKPGSPLHK